jgi:signal transduction histidine kinase
MKLLDHTLRFLSVSLIVILSIWATVFYFAMLEEIYDSIDDGLDNYRLLIIRKAKSDPAILYKHDFGESNYYIREVSAALAGSIREEYKDTLLYMENENDFEPVRMLGTSFSVNGRHYELKVIASMVEEDDLIRNLFYSIIGLYVLILGSVLLVNNLVLKTVWKPFYKVMAQLNSFRLGLSENINPPVTNVQEFRDLNETLHAMLKRNQEIYSSQKHFIENAAHELQTPLAISINKLELLAEKTDLSGKNMEVVGNVIQTLERLTRLNKSLLLLSRIENRQFLSEGKINFNLMAKRIIDDFEDLAKFRNVTINYHETGVMHHRVNNDLAEILFTNLLKNAIIHNEPGGYVKVEIDSSVLSIENSGSAEKLDTERMFSRFYKNSAQKNTTGLGLAIARAIADLYEIRIVYTYSAAHRFELKI